VIDCGVYYAVDSCLPVEKIEECLLVYWDPIWGNYRLYYCDYCPNFCCYRYWWTI